MSPLQRTGYQYGEREFSLNEAERRVQSAIAELGLSAALESYGGDPTVWSCQFFNGTDESPHRLGHGKGGTAAARVGSMYEALEHYLTQQPSGAGVALRPCTEVAASALASEAYTKLLAMQEDRLIACRIYKQLTGDDTLAVPLFLSNASWVEQDTASLRAELGDTTDYRPLARYSSNGGSAIGASLNEAVVHAINEAIELDAVSLFLIRCIATTTPSPPAFLDPATLPEELRTLLDQVQSRIGQEVWLIDITTDLGVPSTLAYLPGPRGHYHVGYGTSLSRRYSIYRALTELLECQLTEDGIADRLDAIELLKDFPALQACAELNLRPLAVSAPRVPYTETTAPAAPAAHLSELLTKLDDRGFTVYLHETHRLSNGIIAVHVHIPGLEHFHLIVDGPSAVVPGRRGMAAAHGP